MTLGARSVPAATSKQSASRLAHRRQPGILFRRSSRRNGQAIELQGGQEDQEAEARYGCRLARQRSRVFSGAKTRRRCRGPRRRQLGICRCRDGRGWARHDRAADRQSVRAGVRSQRQRVRHADREHGRGKPGERGAARRADGVDCEQDLRHGQLSLQKPSRTVPGLRQDRRPVRHVGSHLSPRVLQRHCHGRHPRHLSAANPPRDAGDHQAQHVVQVVGAGGATRRRGQDHVQYDDAHTHAGAVQAQAQGVQGGKGAVQDQQARAGRCRGQAAARGRGQGAEEGKEGGRLPRAAAGPEGEEPPRQVWMRPWCWDL